MHDISLHERPRERLLKYGPEKLTSEELLAVILGSGTQGKNVLELSRDIIRSIRTQTGELYLSRELQIKGLGTTKRAQVLAVLGLAERLGKPERVELLSAKEVWNHCADFRASKREHFVVFYLDTQNVVIDRQTISIGTLDSSIVHPREVFEPAIAKHSAGIIVVHNHPSGITTPSIDDIAITKRLVEAGVLLGIRVLDHVVITAKEYLSFETKGLLFQP
jgi:DNA repair protein RadC